MPLTVTFGPPLRLADLKTEEAGLKAAQSLAEALQRAVAAQKPQEEPDRK